MPQLHAPSLWQLIQEDRKSHNQDWTKPGFRALAVYRLGVWRTSQPLLIRFPLFLLYRICYRYVRNQYGIDLPYTVKVGRRVIFANQGNVVVHPGSVIGDDCLIRQNVTLGAGRGDRFDEAPTLGHHVEVGAGAVIVGKVSIGDHAKLGPNVVVMNNIPANVMVLPPAPRMIPLLKPGLEEQARSAAVTA